MPGGNPLVAAYLTISITCIRLTFLIYIQKLLQVQTQNIAHVKITLKHECHIQVCLAQLQVIDLLNQCQYISIIMARESVCSLGIHMLFCSALLHPKWRENSLRYQCVQCNEWSPEASERVWPTDRPTNRPESVYITLTVFQNPWFPV